MKIENGPRVLVVDDEPSIVDAVATSLRYEGFTVDEAMTGRKALAQAQEDPPDLVILDVMLPVKDGYAVCRELRATGFRTPILMLTARAGVEDKVAGLDCGADDYLIKPFDFQELLARLRALLRRAAQFRPEILRVADLELNTGTHGVARAGKAIGLTAKEYALIEYLMLNENRVVNREQISQHVWDENFDPFSNIIDVYVKRLRTKIDAGFARPLIHTRRGEGYLLTAQPIKSDD